MALINNAIKNTGVTNTGNSSAAANSTNNVKANKKITNGLTSSDSTNNNSDDGDVATDDGGSGAQSTVNSKKQDEKTTVKNGTLTSDVDKSKDPSAPRGGPEGYAAHSPLGFNKDPAAGYTGVPGLPPGAALGGLSGLGSLFGGAGGPSPGGGSGGGGSPSIGSGKGSQPQASRPQEQRETRPQEKFSDKALEIDKANTVSATEKKELAAKYGEANNFLREYNEPILPANAKDRVDEKSPLSMPKNFAANQAFAADEKNGDKFDPKLAGLMQDFQDTRNASVAKAKEIGEKLTSGGDLSKIKEGYNSREFLVGTGDPPVSGLKPIDDAYKAINNHLQEKGYTFTDPESGEKRPLKADDLLDDPEALKKSTIEDSPIEAEKPTEETSRSEQSSFEPKLNLDMDILDNDELASIDYEDDLEFNDIGIDWDLDEEIDDLEIA